MITKGIIQSIDFAGNTCEVRMPLFEHGDNIDVVSTATISNTPGSYNGYKVGDVVYVAFENGITDNAVVIGKLYLGAEKEKADPRGVVNVESSTASKTASLPFDTNLAKQIDTTTPNTQAIYTSLSDVTNNMQKLSTRVDTVNHDLGNQIETIISEVDDQGTKYESELKQTSTNINAKVSRKVNADSADNDKTDSTFGWNLTADDWVVYSEVDSNSDNWQVEALAGADVRFVQEKIWVNDENGNGHYTNGDWYLYINGKKCTAWKEESSISSDPNKLYEEWLATVNDGEVTDTGENANISGLFTITTGKNWSFRKKVTDENWTDTGLVATQKSVIAVDKTGLYVNGDGKFTGDITAQTGYIGKFVIGKEHDCGTTGNKASGIFTDGYLDADGKQIEKYEQTPESTASGVYVGTDGIRVGSKFWVDKEGNLVARSFKISASDRDDAAYSTENLQDGNVTGLNAHCGFDDGSTAAYYIDIDSKNNENVIGSCGRTNNTSSSIAPTAEGYFSNNGRLTQKVLKTNIFKDGVFSLPVYKNSYLQLPFSGKKLKADSIYTISFKQRLNVTEKYRTVDYKTAEQQDPESGELVDRNEFLQNFPFDNVRLQVQYAPGLSSFADLTTTYKNNADRSLFTTDYTSQTTWSSSLYTDEYIDGVHATSAVITDDNINNVKYVSNTLPLEQVHGLENSTYTIIGLKENTWFATIYGVLYEVYCDPITNKITYKKVQLVNNLGQTFELTNVDLHNATVTRKTLTSQKVLLYVDKHLLTNETNNTQIEQFDIYKIVYIEETDTYETISLDTSGLTALLTKRNLKFVRLADFTPNGIISNQVLIRALCTYTANQNAGDHINIQSIAINSDFIFDNAEANWQLEYEYQVNSNADIANGYPIADNGSLNFVVYTGFILKEVTIQDNNIKDIAGLYFVQALTYNGTKWYTYEINSTNLGVQGRITGTLDMGWRWFGSASYESCFEDFDVTGGGSLIGRLKYTKRDTSYIDFSKTITELGGSSPIMNRLSNILSAGSYPEAMHVDSIKNANGSWQQPITHFTVYNNKLLEPNKIVFTFNQNVISIIDIENILIPIPLNEVQFIASNNYCLMHDKDYGDQIFYVKRISDTAYSLTKIARTLGNVSGLMLTNFKSLSFGTGDLSDRLLLGQSLELIASGDNYPYYFSTDYKAKGWEDSEYSTNKKYSKNSNYTLSSGRTITSVSAKTKLLTCINNNTYGQIAVDNWLDLMRDSSETGKTAPWIDTVIQFKTPAELPNNLNAGIKLILSAVEQTDSMITYYANNSAADRFAKISMSPKTLEEVAEKFGKLGVLWQVKDIKIEHNNKATEFEVSTDDRIGKDGVGITDVIPITDKDNNYFKQFNSSVEITTDWETKDYPNSAKLYSLMELIGTATDTQTSYIITMEVTGFTKSTTSGNEVFKLTKKSFVELPKGTTGDAITIKDTQYYYKTNNKDKDKVKEEATYPSVTNDETGKPTIFNKGGWTETKETPDTNKMYIWQTTRHTTIKTDVTSGEQIVIKEEVDVDPKLADSLDSWVSILSADGLDLIAKDTGGEKTTYHLKADNLNGAMGSTVNIGGVKKTDGTFEGGWNIKPYIAAKEETSATAAAIYSGIDCFNSMDSTTGGVYIGTDGIQLGNAFKVDKDGNCTATSLTIMQNQVQNLDTALSEASTKAVNEINGRNYQTSNDVETTLSNKGYQTEEQVTTITNTTISTTNVTAQNLTVKAANIDGTITAGALIVKDTYNKEIFNADSDAYAVTIGGFKVSNASLYNNIDSMESKELEGVYLGTDGFKIGQNFKVDTKGKLTLADDLEMNAAATITCGNGVFSDRLASNTLVGNKIIAENEYKLGNDTIFNTGYSSDTSTKTVYAKAWYDKFDIVVGLYEDVNCSISTTAAESTSWTMTCKYENENYRRFTITVTVAILENQSSGRRNVGIHNWIGTPSLQTNSQEVSETTSNRWTMCQRGMWTEQNLHIGNGIGATELWCNKEKAISFRQSDNKVYSGGLSLDLNNDAISFEHAVEPQHQISTYDSTGKKYTISTPGDTQTLFKNIQVGIVELATAAQKIDNLEVKYKRAFSSGTIVVMICPMDGDKSDHAFVGYKLTYKDKNGFKVSLYGNGSSDLVKYIQWVAFGY